MRGPRPVQGAHDGAVRLPQVQLSVQKGEQVRAVCFLGERFDRIRL